MYGKLKLIHLMVSTGGVDLKGNLMERKGRCYAVASMWSNYEDTNTFKMLFLYIHSLLPGVFIKLLALLTDLLAAVKSWFSSSNGDFEPTFHWLVCKYHLVKLIREHMIDDLLISPPWMDLEEWKKNYL